MKKFLLLTFIGLAFQAQSQVRTKAIPEHYNYPLEDYYQPLTIRTNAVVLYRNDGKGNFDLNNAEEKQLLFEYLDYANYVFSNFKQPADLSGCYTGTDFIKDAKIRFTFNFIPVKNTFYWDYLNSGAIPEEKKFAGFTPSEKWYIKNLDDSISNLNIPKAMNIYLTQNGKRYDDLIAKKGKGYDLAGNQGGQFPTDRDLKRSSQVHAPNAYLDYIYKRYQVPIDYKTTWKETKYWWISPGLAHEFGHDLGLSHSNEYHGTNKCTYSLMSQKHKDQRNWLPPTEIKRMHWVLSTTNMMQFVTPESAYGAVWKLNEDTTWNKPRRFYHNFEIASGKTLTISELVILPPQAYVKLNKDSRLVFIGNGKLVDAYGNDFKNIEKHKKSKIIGQN